MAVTFVSGEALEKTSPTNLTLLYLAISG